MARTKLTARRNYNLKRNNFQRQQPQTRARPRPNRNIGVKNIENSRQRNKDIKIKRLLAQSKNIVEVKHRGRTMRRMTVILNLIFQLKEDNANINYKQNTP